MDTTTDQIQHTDQTTLVDHIDQLAIQTDTEIVVQIEIIVIEVHLALEIRTQQELHQTEVHRHQGVLTTEDLHLAEIQQ